MIPKLRYILIIEINFNKEFKEFTITCIYIIKRYNYSLLKKSSFKKFSPTINYFLFYGK